MPCDRQVRVPRTLLVLPMFSTVLEAGLMVRHMRLDTSIVFVPLRILVLALVGRERAHKQILAVAFRYVLARPV